MELQLWDKIHLEGSQRVLDTDGLETAISVLVVPLCWYQVAVSEPPAEPRPKSCNPPRLHNLDAVVGMKENAALPACRDKGGSLLHLDCS